jgi:hypothetical protein
MFWQKMIGCLDDSHEAFSTSFLLWTTPNPFTLISDLKYEHRRSPRGLQVLWQAEGSEDCLE